MTNVHGRDLTAMFRKLVDGDFLEPEGIGRGTCYYLSGTTDSSDYVIEDVQTGVVTASEQIPNIITDASEHLEATSEHLSQKFEQRETPEAIAKHVRDVGKVSKTVMIETILRLCRDEFMPLKQMAQLLGRSADTIRVHYLNKMVSGGTLELKHPSQTNHPNQAYRAKSQG